MPCAHGSTTNNSGKLVKSGGGILSKSYLDHKTSKLSSKDHKGPTTPILRNSEQRCIILIALELDAWKFLVPFSLLMQGAELKSHSNNDANVKGGGLDSSSPPLVLILQADLPTNQKINPSESPSSVESCSSPGANILHRSRNRNKWTKTLKSPPTISVPDSIKSNNFSQSNYDGSVVANSDVLANKTPKVDKPAKRARKKNGKKKGKQSKKRMQEKVSPMLETQCEEKISDASVSGMFTCSDTTIASEFNSQNNMPKNITSCSVSIQDIKVEQNVEKSLNAPRIKKGIHCDISGSISFDKDNVSVVGSYTDNMKIDVSKSYSNVVETLSSIEDDEGLYPSKGGIILNTNENDTLFRNVVEDSCDNDSEMSACCSSCYTLSKDITYTDYSTERAECSSQASSSNDFQPVVNRKRGRLIKKASQTFNGIHRFGNADIIDSRRKGINPSFWQKVHRNGAEEYIGEPKKANLVSSPVRMSSKDSYGKDCFDTSTRLKQNRSGKFQSHTYSESPVQTARTDPVKACSMSCDSSKILPEGITRKSSVPEKLRTVNSASKQGIHYPTMVSHVDNTNMDSPSKLCGQPKGLEMSPESTHQQCISIGFNSSCSFDFENVVVMATENDDFCQPEPHDKNIGEVETLAGDIHTRKHDTSSNVAENPISPSVMTGQIRIKDLCEDICLHTDSEDCRYMKSESEISHTDNRKLEKASSSLSQNCVPIDRTDTVTPSVSSESALHSSNSMNQDMEMSSCSTHHSLQMNGGEPQANNSFEDTVRVSPGLNNYHPHKYGEYGGFLSLPNYCLTYEVKDHNFLGYDTDLDKILQAVHGSCKVQTSLEGIRMETGSPVAEFEKFLHSASPHLDQVCCRTCFPAQLVGDSFCEHQIPNIPLECLWQWYEKPGCYGIEVKVEDHHSSKRSRNGRSEFHAYFVPYLSAIQLFGWSRSSKCANNCYRGEEMIENCEPDGVCNQTVRSAQLDDVELLFEYFESDQPQQRRPLFEKIKELVRDGASSDSKVVGDPLKLESLNLFDLHPASWYCVAWYPIYRIPDGNFRAAFLTYHSFGRFVSSPSQKPSSGVQIRSPVVGLLSYNAKGEYWFQSRGPKSVVAETEVTRSFVLSEKLKERLRTLEQTASSMARASVRKGNQISANKQPDYEFFISRGR